MAALSNLLAQQLSQYVFEGTTFTPPTPFTVALFTTQQNASDTGTEVSGGGYSRQPITFTQTTSGAIESNIAATFTNMPACTVVSVGVYGMTSSATPVPYLLFFGALTPQICASGDTMVIPGATIGLSFA